MPPRPAVLEVPGAQEGDAEENAEAAQATQLATRLNEEAERARQEHLLWDRYAPAELTDVYAKRSMCRKELREAIAAAAAFAERQRRGTRRGTPGSSSCTSSSRCSPNCSCKLTKREKFTS